MRILSLCFIAALAPITRLIPLLNTAYAGRLSWLSAFAALPFVVLYCLYLSVFFKCIREGEGFGELILRAAGSLPGRFMLFLIGAYFLFYIALLLLSGADRYISTVFTAGKPWSFIAVMLLLALICSLGNAKTLLRLSKILLPLISAVLILLIAFSLSSADLRSLLPVKAQDALPVLRSTLPVIDIVFTIPAVAGFLLSYEDKKPRARGILILCLSICLVIATVSASIVGSFGPALTLRLPHPFFVMVRNVTLFGTIERIEAVIVSLWLFSDFALLSMLLISASRCMRLALGFMAVDCSAKLLDMKNGRFIIPVCAAVTLAAAIFLGNENRDLLDSLSQQLIPMLNLTLTVVLLPMIFVIGKLRKAL